MTAAGPHTPEKNEADVERTQREWGGAGGTTDVDGRRGGDSGAPPGVPATRRNRAKSALLWGLVGGFAFLVLAQGYLLLGGTVPVGYAWLFVIAAGAVVGSSGLTYVLEHRVSKRRT